MDALQIHHLADCNKLKHRVPTRQKRVLDDRHTAPGAKVGKSVLTMKENLWENDFNVVNIIVSEGKKTLHIPKK